MISFFLISLSVLSTAQAAPTEFHCYAQCVAIDWVAEEVYSWPVSGESEYSSAEAYKEMDLNCQDAIANSPAAPYIQTNGRYLAQSFKFNRKRSTREEYAPDYWWWYYITYDRDDQMHFNVDQSATERNSCTPVGVNPQGVPKYLGRQKPLG